MIAFLGFGDLGLQIEGFLKESGATIDAHYFDDLFKDNNKQIYPYKSYIEYINQYDWIVSLGYNRLDEKQIVLRSILESGGKLLTVKHPSSFISSRAIVKQGVIIYPMCNIDKGVILEEGVLLNNSVTISHDCKIGQCTYLGPGVVVSGNTTIGNGCFIGSGSVISNGVHIGDNAIVGIGSVVTKDIGADLSGIGNPFKVIKAPLKLI